MAAEKLRRGPKPKIKDTPREELFRVKCTPEEKTSLEEFWAELKVIREQEGAKKS